MAVVNSYDYIVRYCYPGYTGGYTDVKIITESTEHIVSSAPPDYDTGKTLSAWYQQYTDDSLSVAVTSSWQSGTFKIKYRYLGWRDNNGTLYWPGDKLDLQSAPKTYIVENNTSVIKLEAYKVSTIAVGTTATGCYEYKDVVLTGKCNYTGGTDTSVTLKNQKRRFYCAARWTQVEGMGINFVAGFSPEISLDSIPGFNESSSTTIHFKGVHDYKTSWERVGGGAYTDLPKPSRSSSTTSHTVNLKTSNNVTHKDETLNVSSIVNYSFKHWSLTTTGDEIDEKSHPMENTTLYAIWEETRTPTTTLPEWTTEDTVRYGDSPFRAISLKCWATQQSTDPYFTKTVQEYEFKPAKHARWTLNGTSYDIGSVVTGGSGSTYTAVWEPDASGTSVYRLDDNIVDHPFPPERVGYIYLGLDIDPKAKNPMYAVNLDNNSASSVTIQDNMNLYGIWKAKGSGHLFDGTSFKIYQIYIYDGTSWKLYLPKIFNGTNWEDAYI